MGVQGLTTLLESGSRPHVVSFLDGEAAGRPDNLLLVDASAVFYHVAKKHADAFLGPIQQLHKTLFFETCRFLGGLQRTGLNCVLITDSATAPEHEANYTARRRNASRRLVIPPTVDAVVGQACRDLGLAVIRSAHSADPLLLAWALRNRDSLFALLTADSDFYVYGVPRIVHPHEVVVDAHCVSFSLWHTDELWRAWHITAAGRAAAFVPPLLQRAQIAAVMGNDLSKGLRHRLEQRRKAAFAGLTAARAISPSMAARAVVNRRDPSAPLDVSFFRQPPIHLREFDESDLVEFNAIVQSYLDEHTAAANGTALRQLTLTPEALPWLEPAVAARLVGGGPLPGYLLNVACRGFTCLDQPDPLWLPHQALRRRIVQQLLANAAPGAPFEFQPDANVLHRLAVGQADGDAVASTQIPPAGRARAALTTEELLRALWFTPQVYLPGMEVVGARDQSNAAADVLDVQRSATFAETVQALRAAAPELPEALAMFYALCLHCVDPDEAAWVEEQVRQVLLPGVPLRHGAVPLAANGAAAEEAAEEEGVPPAARSATGASIVDVGSTLDEQDWLDIDAKDVVARVRGSAGYNLMRRIQPWSLELASQRGGGVGGAAATGSARLFNLAREAMAEGPGSPQWAEAQRAWSSARPQARQQALSEAWSSANRWSASAAGPMRHRHQQELLDLVDEHLARNMERRPRRPLHVILSTPTGSGKTFTAVMMQLHVLKAAAEPGPGAGGGKGPAAAVAAVAAEERPGHPNAVLLYSVPTKQVLKRVGQECEAHGVVYWTAASDGDVYQVRRPYSIRTKRGKGSSGAGPMARQLQERAQQGRDLEDRGGGKPDVIIADVFATAAILRASREANPDDFYHWSHLVLYLDEPNMGIHMDRQLRGVVRSIMASAPLTTILASATLPPWDDLPAWWKGSGAQGATHHVISQEPYELPMCRLSVLDAVSGLLAPLSPLDVFDDAAEFSTTLDRSPRTRVLLLRHFTAEQANQLLGLQADGTPAAAGVQGDGEAEDDTWRVLDQDVRSLRSELLEPEVMRLAGQPERFTQLREEWRQPAKSADKGLPDVLSKQGVTLVATLAPRQVALRLAGKGVDPDTWAREARDMRGRVRAAAAEKRAADKARERAARRGDEDGGRAGGRDDGLSGAGRLMLRPGLVVWADEADEVVDDDTLVMLSKGVAYTATKGVEPLVKRLYQQALLYIPERADARPPLHTLVVDYSAVYGTDCPAVDTIVLCADLAATLSWEDHQQFLGRLRRDGTAIYPSRDLLRRAVLGGGPRQWREWEQRQVEGQRQAVEGVLARHVAPPAEPPAGAASGGGGDTTKLAAKELLSLVRPAFFSRSEAGSLVLKAALRDLVAPRPPLAGDAAAAAAAAAEAAVGALASDTQLCAGALRRLKRWGSLKPLELLEALRLGRAAEQQRLVAALEELCVKEPAAAAARGGGEAAAAAGADADAGAAGRRFLPCLPRLLQELANEEVVEEEAMSAWCEEDEEARRAAGVTAESEGGKAFRQAVVRVRDWLQEQEEDEESEEGEE